LLSICTSPGCVRVTLFEKGSTTREIGGKKLAVSEVAALLSKVAGICYLLACVCVSVFGRAREKIGKEKKKNSQADGAHAAYLDFVMRSVGLSTLLNVTLTD